MILIPCTKAKIRNNWILKYDYKVMTLGRGEDLFFLLMGTREIIEGDIWYFDERGETFSILGRRSPNYWVD